MNNPPPAGLHGPREQVPGFLGWPSLAMLVAAAIFAGACSGATSSLVVPIEGESSDDYPEAAFVDPSVEVSGEPGDVVEQDCPVGLAGTGLRCVWVIVPIDRADPAAGSMAVSVAIRPGTGGESLAPLAVLQGGPGGASSDLARFLPSRPYPQVLIDQRGVGFGSTNFWCGEWQVRLAEIFEAPRDEADAVASEAFERCSDRFRRDPVFAHTSTEAHAADVVDVMTALGYDRWLLYGVSYGTTIALEVLRDAPAGLSGAVLDGVYPGHFDLDAAIATGAERVIRQLDEECSADPACSAILATSGEDTTMAGLLAELIPRFNADPIVVPFSANETTLLEPFDSLIDGDSISGAVFQMLYNDFTATLVPGVLAGLARVEEADSEPGGALAAAQAVALLGVETVSQQAHTGAPATFAAVTCAEWLSQASGPPSGIGPFGAAVLGDGLSAHCEPWAVEVSALPTEPVRSDLPVLLISGRFDPITPPSFAEAAAEHLPRGTHVVTRTRGHGIWVWGYDNCVDRVVADFLAEPGVELDVACAGEDRPLRWQPLP